jgi:hypothetical protein
MARALRPGGVMATDLEDFEWAEARAEQDVHARVGDDWAIVTFFSSPARDSYVRDMTTFLRNDDGTWRRGHVRHDNVLLDVSAVPPLLAAEGIEAEARRSFGAWDLPVGLFAVVGRKRDE